jgi:hypothetical protein
MADVECNFRRGCNTSGSAALDLYWAETAAAVAVAGSYLIWQELLSAAQRMAKESQAGGGMASPG